MLHEQRFAMKWIGLSVLVFFANTALGVTMPLDTASFALNDSSVLSRGVHLENVTVYGSHNNFGVTSSQMSAVSIGQNHILSTPIFLGDHDVLKTLQKFPGVQSGSEGTAGIYVRGGDYDQNYITLDGSAIYNAEHMRGYVSAINPDMVSSINFYRGAFPARFGSRLSSVVDVGIKAGDFNRFHGLLSLGCLAGRAQIEGPIWKNHTSFNLAARMSYLNLIAKPVLKHYYDRPEAFQPYSNMKYYDITAKIVHRFNDRNRLTAVAYFGKDFDDENPTESEYYVNTLGEEESSEVQRYEENRYQFSQSTRNWENLLMSLYYTTYINSDHRMNFNLSYSGYEYRMSVSSDFSDRIVDAIRLYSSQKEKYVLSSSSGVKDMSFTFDGVLSRTAHQFRYGLKYAHQSFEPKTTVYKDAYSTIYRKGLNFAGDDSELDPKYYEFTEHVDYINDNSGNIENLSLYGEDVFLLSSKLEFNYGIRLNSYFVKDKSYFAIEPRLSFRYLIANNLSAKASYSLMSQGLHRLVSNNLVMPSDIWVPVTKDIPLMKSHLFGIGLNYDFKGITLAAEAYYKTLDHVIEYRNGASYFINDQKWEEIIAQGEGRNYGFELLVERKVGKTTGWMSYTWSKALRTFDRPDNEINGGKEFYASTDRRHNFSANISQNVRLSKSVEMNLSASWTYQTGRRGTVPYTIVYGQGLQEHNFHMPVIAYGKTLFYYVDFITLDINDAYDVAFSGVSVAQPMPTFKHINDFKLPDVHHLDINVNLSIKSRLGVSMIDIGCYNVYNRYNISNVYVGYTNNRSVLKGICPFPIMPSISITQTF